MAGGLVRLDTRRMGAIGGVLAVVLAVVGIAVVLSRPHHGQPARDTLRVVDSMPSDSPTAEPSETASPSPSRSPKASPSAEPSASVSPTDGGSSGGSSGSGDPVMTDLGPIPPGTTVYGYSPGRDSWSASGDGVDLHVSMSPASPHAGQTVTFTFHSTAPAGCCKGFILFGNGRATDNSTDCMQFPSGTAFSTTYTTIYNKSGRYEFEAVAYAHNCDRSASFCAWIDIASGTSTAQGPELPVVKVDSSTPAPGHENDPSYVTLWGTGTDDDGFVRHLVVDWGDGTSTTFPGDTDCQEAADGWPAGSEADVPYDPPPVHHYKSYGDFRITLTAISTACDGSDAQRGHASMTWSNPAPPKPSPSPSASQTASP